MLLNTLANSCEQFLFQSDNLKRPTMVWEIKTNQMPSTVQKVLLVMDKRTSGMNEALDLLKCNENIPSSPGYASSDEHMELGKYPFKPAF